MDFPLNALGLSHKWISEHVKKGDLCIDATCGRGRDTLFLAKAVGQTGHVHAFDIQRIAIEETARLLESENIHHVSLHQHCHSRMAEFTEEGSISAVMFNFGWLPGGDHTLFSKPESSILALESAMRLLKVGGIITLCIYYGKETGFAERDALLSWLEQVDQKKFSVLKADFINRKNQPPIAVFIQKEG